MPDEDDVVVDDVPRSWSSRLTAALAPKPKAASDTEPPPVSSARVGRAMKVLDATERKWGFGATAIVFAATLTYLPFVLHNTKVTKTADKVSGHCPAHYTLVAKTCTQYVLHHPSEYWPLFAASLAFAAVMLVSVVRSMRTLAVFMAFLSGLALSGLNPIATLAGFAWGGWVLMRSWRLSRYGSKDAKEVRAITAERVAEKREAKKAAAAAPAVVATTATGRTAAAPSKRYTPKSKPKRR